MTPKQKRERILLIEKDVNEIMMQLHMIEHKVESNLVRREELPFVIPDLPEIKMPQFLKSLWAGFKMELKQKNLDKKDNL